MTKSNTKGVHNGGLALHAKVTMRERVLENVASARVFDAFCGPDGEMWRLVWQRAESYVGCDEVYKPFDPRRRFVGDNKRIMRAIDLTAFNVFDLDAFGEPWEQLLILSARRTWKAGERGAIILTWSDMHTRWGTASHALAQAAGFLSRKLGVADGNTTLAPMAIRGFLKKSRLRAVGSWRASGINTAGKRLATGGPASGNQQFYQAVIFDGVDEAA